MDGEDDSLDELRNQIKKLREKYEAQQKLLRDLRESIEQQQQEVDELRRELARKRMQTIKLKEENQQLQDYRKGLKQVQIDQIKKQLEEIESIDIVVLPKNIVVIKFNYKKR